MKTILAIDDEPLVREVVKAILDLEGFTTITAQNGEIGLRLAKERVPTLIVCDVMMPELDGYGVLSALREDPQTAHIPFIFLTSNTDLDSRDRRMPLAAIGYVAKPFHIHDLLETVSTLID